MAHLVGLDNITRFELVKQCCPILQMGLIGKWLFCVKCQYFYPNKAVLESHEVRLYNNIVFQLESPFYFLD